MSIASRIEAIEQHLTDDYDVLELAGADLTNVDKNIFNLKQSWEERLLYFLANGTDVIWNNWLPKVNGTGETITLNNTIQAKMKIKLKGNTEQATRSGKNLFNKNTIQENYELFSNDGTTGVKDGWYVSDYMPKLMVEKRILKVALEAGVYRQLLDDAGCISRGFVFICDC